MQALAIRQRYLQAVREEAGAANSGCARGVMLLLGVLKILTIVGMRSGLQIVRGATSIGQLAGRYRVAQAFAELAEPVMAYPLMVNRMLRRPGDDPAPGLFLICLGPQGESIGFMSDLAVKVGEADDPGMSAEDRAFCEALLADEDYVPFRRRRLPASITGGVEVFAVDVFIMPELLKDRHISDEMPLVPCMAETGERGRILQMPWWFVAGQDRGDREGEQAFTLSLMLLSELEKKRR
jgi:hypothetical protein